MGKRRKDSLSIYFEENLFYNSFVIKKDWTVINIHLLDRALLQFQREAAAGIGYIRAMILHNHYNIRKIDIDCRH